MRAGVPTSCGKASTGETSAGEASSGTASLARGAGGIEMVGGVASGLDDKSIVLMRVFKSELAAVNVPTVAKNSHN
jgi:hypothetical protein